MANLNGPMQDRHRHRWDDLRGGEKLIRLQTTAPGPVSDMRVQPMGADTLQISWRPPVNPNGLITSYEITYQLVSRGMCDNNQDAPRTVSISGTSYVLNGLYPHSKYRQGYAVLKMAI